MTYAQDFEKLKNIFVKSSFASQRQNCYIKFPIKSVPTSQGCGGISCRSTFDIPWNSGALYSFYRQVRSHKSRYHKSLIGAGTTWDAAAPMEEGYTALLRQNSLYCTLTPMANPLGRNKFQVSSSSFVRLWWGGASQCFVRTIGTIRQHLFQGSRAIMQMLVWSTLYLTKPKYFLAALYIWTGDSIAWSFLRTSLRIKTISSIGITQKSMRLSWLQAINRDKRKR